MNEKVLTITTTTTTNDLEAAFSLVKNIENQSEQRKFDLEEILLAIRVVYMRTISVIWKSDQTERVEEFNDIEKVLNKLKAKKKEIAITTMEVKDLIDHLNKLTKSISDEKKDVIGKLEKLNKRIKELLDDHIYLPLVMLELGWSRVFIEVCDVDNLKTVWGTYFNSNFQQENFGIQIIRPTARWNYYGDNQWTKPDTEVLYMGLPVLPDNTSSEFDKSEYLMEYYLKFPNFLGAESPTIKDKNKVLDNDYKGAFIFLEKKTIPPIDQTLQLVKRDFNIQEKDPYGNNFDLGIASGSFLSFSSMFIRLIAVIWDNDQLKLRMDYALRLFNETDLLKDFDEDKEGKIEVSSIYSLSFYLNSLEGEQAEELKKFDEAYDLEMMAILKKYFHYESPWVFHFRFLMPNSRVFFVKSKDGTDSAWNLNPSKKHVVNLTTIEVPHAPGSKPSNSNGQNNIALALARYNATGPAYPFTCS